MREKLERPWRQLKERTAENLVSPPNENEHSEL